MKSIIAILIFLTLVGTTYAKIGFDFSMSLGSGGAILKSVSKEDGTNATKEDGTDWLTEG